MLSRKDMVDARGGYFLAAGIWLFGITLLIAFMGYNAYRKGY